MSERAYRISVENLRRCFPLHLEAPPLLIDFAEWLDGRPWGRVGWFELVGQFSEQAPIVDGSLLRNEFALFMHLPQGSAVGAWCLPGTEPAQSPIVVLGSEGQFEILAGSLACLLSRIALRKFDDAPWSDFAPDDDAEDDTGELGEWLRRRLGREDLEAVARMGNGLPDFLGRMERWSEQREEYWRSHPLMRELASQLQAHRPADDVPWGHTCFEVAMVGARYQARVLQGGRRHFEEATAIEPILRRLRDDMLEEFPALGLWSSMNFQLDASGTLLPSFDYEDRPSFDEGPVDIAEARSDLARAPRPERWIPGWVNAGR